MIYVLRKIETVFENADACEYENPYSNMLMHVNMRNRIRKC